MPRSIEMPFGQVTLQLALSTLVIRLYVFDTNPAHINPDFLRFNDIVPPDWVVVRPVLAEPALSRVNYSNGVSIFGSDEEVSFRQVNLLNDDVELLVPELASRYLETPRPGLIVDSVSIEPTCVLKYPPSGEPPLQPKVSHRFNTAVLIDQIEPQMLISSMYRYHDKDVAITISEESTDTDVADTDIADTDVADTDAAVIELNISGQLHFPISDENYLTTARDHVYRWRQELHEFYLLATEVCSRQISIGDWQ
jgi:hypothetical protein